MASRKTKAFTSFGVAMLFVLAFALYFQSTFKTVVVKGDSMLPNLANGRKVLVSHAYWLVGPIKRKDIVVIQGDTPDEYIIKRVYRMAGEIVDW